MKPTEEEIKAEAMTRYSHHQKDESSNTCNKYNAFIKGAEYVLSQIGDGWISVDERLPEDNHIVGPGQPQTKIVLLNDRTILMGEYESHVWRIYWREGLSEIYQTNRLVTHWQPLPKAPKQ